MGFFDKILSIFKKPESNAESHQEVPSNSHSSGQSQNSQPQNPSQDNNSLAPSTSAISDNRETSSLNTSHAGNSSVVLVRVDNALPHTSTLDSNGSNDIIDNTSIEAIRAAEEERKKKEWLEFLKTKRAKRRKELEEELAIIDKQLNQILENIESIKEDRKNISKSSLPAFSIETESSRVPEPKIFSTSEYESITSMADYRQQRIEEERRKIAEAEKVTRMGIKEIRKAIDNRNLKDALEELDRVAQQAQYIEDPELKNEIKDLVLSITELRNSIEAEKRAKEEERRKKEALEAQQRAEALERERAAKEAQRLQEESDRKERDRRYREELLAKEEQERKEAEQLKNLSEILKGDAKDIVRYFREMGIYYFYHFTDASNIPLIKQRKGLFSWSYLASHNLRIPAPGGNDTSRGLDRDKGLEDYVRLSLCKSHPMAYRIFQESQGRANLVLLKIKIDVSMFESTKFSDINATDKRAQIGTDKEFIEENFDFDAIGMKWCRSTNPKHKKRQAEILVKTHIPAKFIENLNYPEQMTFNE